MMSGTSIVPVFSFGEVDIYDQAECIPGTRWYNFREMVKRKIGILPCLFNGRGLLQHSFGIIPRRRPITTVVGSPIDVTQIKNPSCDQIEKLHELFCDELRTLFDTHKSKYIKNHENVQLLIE